MLWIEWELLIAVLVTDFYWITIFRLYSKESILEFLLDKSKFQVLSGFDHIRGLKVINLYIKSFNLLIVQWLLNYIKYIYFLLMHECFILLTFCMTAFKLICVCVYIYIYIYIYIYTHIHTHTHIWLSFHWRW